MHYRQEVIPQPFFSLYLNKCQTRCHEHILFFLKRLHQIGIGGLETLPQYGEHGHNERHKGANDVLYPLPARIHILQRVVQTIRIPVEALREVGALDVVVRREEARERRGVHPTVGFAQSPCARHS